MLGCLAQVERALAESSIGGLDLVLNHMRQHRLVDLARVVGLLRRPVPERRPEPVRHGGDLVVLKHLGQRRRRHRPPAPHGEHHPARTVAERPRRIEDLSSARPQSGTRCSRFAFIRAAEIVHTAPAASISSHVASRTSPDRAAVGTRNSNASLTAGCADFEPRTVSIAAATSLCIAVGQARTSSLTSPKTSSRFAGSAPRGQFRLGRRDRHRGRLAEHDALRQLVVQDPDHPVASVGKRPLYLAIVVSTPNRMVLTREGRPPE